MNTASLNDIKKELLSLDASTLQVLVMRLAKYKKENKELLTYLLFEEQDESAYVESVKNEIDELFKLVPEGNLYFVRKNLRKILRMANRQIRYSGIRQSEIEIRIHYCTRLKESGVPIDSSAAIGNLYQQQIKKINAALQKLPEDLQFDYHQPLANLA
jgi:hypothetical protein